MKLSTGRWVSGDDFFDREAELRILKRMVLDGNHVLLTGQRRMGKTSIVQDLGRRLKGEGWLFLFADVEGGMCAEDVVAEMAKAAYPAHALSSRITAGMRLLLSGHIDEVNAYDFKVKFRAELDTGNWRRHGNKYSVGAPNKIGGYSLSSMSCRSCSSECSFSPMVSSMSTRF